MPTTLHENRPSAGIGMVEVQKPMVFCDFESSRATLCGDRRGRGAKTGGFLRFLKFPRDPLRGSAWSRCKNPWFFAISKVPARPSAGACKNPWFFPISNMLARPSAGIGVVEVQKLEVFCNVCGARATLCGNRRGRGAKTRGFFAWFELVLGSCLVVRAPGRGFDSSLVRGRASRDATCILKQLAQSNLRRASCTEQLAQTNLHRPVCAERLA